ncbi:DUF3307 domain-containing protein [Frigoriflavimonas asaccharolytica]|uniref:DUF3307 domain-containing protein n=1 Tax=Frigoriflavimonas asaccharolytica TaxID=2735899 RepID=A0A8J8G950_9FLAO|nr:DUF3307 domain-containing protein [Frigoriflavimonas asaccharolytica]NRS91555.1 hypothetical protein [Frigoriflavimonas asaccharolytica]
MIFLLLILAHLLGDFILQPNSWVADKEKKKLKSIYLYIHVLIHAALTAIFLWDLQLWWMVAIIAISHFLIDAAKLLYQKANNRKFWFFLDQALHIFIILGLLFILNGLDFNFEITHQTVKIITGFVFITVPTSILIKNLLSAWSPITIDHSKIQTESLVNAGKYIGILERVLVFIFIIVNHWEGVGFMIAAKSVFRFSDLAEAKQRKLTEYVLIGTLLSFGIAILTAMAINY